MAIHIPALFPPFRWTKASWDAWMKHHHASMRYINAYRDTIGIFAIFSPKKNRALKEAEQEYKAATKNYYKVLKSEGQ